MMYSTARKVAARTSPGMKAGADAQHICNDKNDAALSQFATVNIRAATQLSDRLVALWLPLLSIFVFLRVMEVIWSPQVQQTCGSRTTDEERHAGILRH